jgi:hypothetical protein
MTGIEAYCKTLVCEAERNRVFRDCGLEFKKSAWVLIKQFMRIQMGVLYLSVQ